MAVTRSLLLEGNGTWATPQSRSPASSLSAKQKRYLRQIAAIVESSDDAISATHWTGRSRAGTRRQNASTGIRRRRRSASRSRCSCRTRCEATCRDSRAGAGGRPGGAVRDRSDPQGRHGDRRLADDLGGQGPSGAVVGASTIARDIHERLRGVEALHQSEDSYRALFERHPGPMWLYDLDTRRFLTVNEAAVASYGYSREEFLAMTIDKILAPEDETAFREGVDQKAGTDRSLAATAGRTAASSMSWSRRTRSSSRDARPVLSSLRT